MAAPTHELVLLPLPLGEGWGSRGAFEPHAASPRDGSGLQAGARTASEGLEPRHIPSRALTLTLSQREREHAGGG